MGTLSATQPAPHPWIEYFILAPADRNNIESNKYPLYIYCVLRPQPQTNTCSNHKHKYIVTQDFPVSVISHPWILVPPVQKLKLNIQYYWDDGISQANHILGTVIMHKTKQFTQADQQAKYVTFIFLSSLFQEKRAPE